jgi:hypothetical protein
VKPKATCQALCHGQLHRIRRRRRPPTNTPASGASNQRERPCASAKRPLRERRRARCGVQERRAKHTRLARVIYAFERVFRETRRTTQHPAPVRERTLNKLGEAPVKYELTGASGHCEPKLASWRRSIKCLPGPLGNRLRRLFSVIGVSSGINGVSKELIPTKGPGGVSLRGSNEPKQQTESALPGPCRV